MKTEKLDFTFYFNQEIMLSQGSPKAHWQLPGRRPDSSPGSCPTVTLVVVADLPAALTAALVDVAANLTAADLAADLTAALAAALTFDSCSLCSSSRPDSCSGSQLDSCPSDSPHLTWSEVGRLRRRNFLHSWTLGASSSSPSICSPYCFFNCSVNLTSVADPD